MSNMSNIKIFENREFGQVRTVEQDNQVWFVAKDVCDCLELSDTNKATTKLDADELTRIKIVSGGQNREMLAVNEYGLYRLTLSSRKKEAKIFQDWIVKEVLPSIRKHGGYVSGQEQMSPEELMARALQYADSKIKEMQHRLNTQDVEISHLTVQTEIMRPKAEYFDELVNRNCLTSLRETSKELKIPEKKFIGFLLDYKYLYRDQKGKLLPYAGDRTAGLFEVKETKNDKTAWSGVQTLVTPKGKETFRLLMQGLAN